MCVCMCGERETETKTERKTDKDIKGDKKKTCTNFVYLTKFLFTIIRVNKSFDMFFSDTSYEKHRRLNKQ